MGRKALDLFKQYLAAMHWEYTPRYRLLEDTGYHYEPQPKSVKFVRLGNYQAQLNLRIKNARELMHVVGRVRDTVMQEVSSLLSRPLQSAEIYPACVQANTLVTTYHLEVLQYIVLKFDPEEEAVEPFFMALARSLTEVNKAVFNTYDRLSGGKVVPHAVLEALLPLIPAFAESIFVCAYTHLRPYFKSDPFDSDTPESRPYEKKHLRTLLSLATSEEFFKVRLLLEFYEVDFNQLFEKDVLTAVVAHYRSTGNDDCYDNETVFYKQHNGRTTLMGLPALQALFAADFEEQLYRRSKTRLKIKKRTTITDVFGDLLAAADACPHLTGAMRAALSSKAAELFEELKANRPRGLFHWR